MCLQHDPDPVCTPGWCREAQTGKPKPVHARRNSFSGREGKYSCYPSNILARFNSLPRVAWHIKFFSLSTSGNQKMLSAKKQDSSSQQLETASTYNLSVIYQLLALLMSFESCSVFGLGAFVVDPALFQT